MAFLVHCDVVSASTHSKLSHHSSAQLVNLLEIVRSSRTDLTKVHLLASSSPKHNGNSINQIALGDDVAGLRKILGISECSFGSWYDCEFD